MIRLLRPEELKGIISSARARLSRNSTTGTVEGDVYEESDSYEIEVDAPGVADADIQLRYVDTAIHIRMDRFRAARDGYELVIGSRPMRFEGKIMLPMDAGVDPEQASATLRANGTLRISLPKNRPAETDLADESDQTSSTEGPDTE